ncbi:MAG: cyclic nucleotide-binding domain-containing protein [Marinomonas sp.]
MIDLSPALLIHAGALLYIIAFIVRDELVLRLLVVIGSGLYILYYYLFPAAPLWDAIISSVIMVGANFYVIAQVILERTTFRMSDSERRLFDAFETLNPGQFRQLLKHAEWKTASSEEGDVLTREGETTPALYYVVDGTIAAQKEDQRFRLPAGNFVGEIAYILGIATTATTIAPEGTRYVRWDADVLRRLSDKRPALGNALNALLTRDLAIKLKTSYQPRNAMPADRRTEILLGQA